MEQRKAVAIVAALILAFAIGGQLPQDVSTTVFGKNGKQRQDPLVVLQANTADGGGASPPPDLEIFAEDPKYASQVHHFMAATGADTRGIENTLSGVRQVSWESGLTLRRRHIVLLAFADDTQPDGDVGGSCRLTRAVSAASRHTTDAHFVLVAEGFELETATREDLESILDGRGWRSFTAIEVPEFEGFSSAVNRAMKIVPDHSLVTVLSTSVVLLPTGTADDTVLETSKAEEGKVAGDASNDARGEETPHDIFVAYERMKISSSVLPLQVVLNNRNSSSESHTEAAGKFCCVNDAEGGSTGEERAPYDPYGCARQRSNHCNQRAGFLVTTSPPRLITSRPRDHGDGSATSSRGNVRIGKTEETRRMRFSAGWQRPPAARREAPAIRLTDVAPLPLLVFDSETFLALGELDERFAFQGGIAEWISRAKLNGGDQGRNNNTSTDGYCCHASYRSSDRPQWSKSAALDCGTSSRSSASAGKVQHVHEQEWGRRFVGSWPDDVTTADDTIQPRGSAAEQSMPGALSPSVDPLSNFGQNDQAGEQVLFREDGDEDGSSQPRNSEGARKIEEVVLDRGIRLPPAKLEALVQADADLFFMPLLLSRQSPVISTHDEAHPVERCVSFHSEWMERAPDKVLVREALVRRNKFPVAIVVVVHDEISLMLEALEEVAVVVEHILVVVSLTPWNGDAKDVSPTLKLLDGMLADVDSPTHGKLRVELGSWATEREQREYGNTVIREDPRDFFRVVVMDTDEFWHPVELAKALVAAARHPETTHSQAVRDTYWVSMRSLVLPEVLSVVWLVDPRRCVWGELRELMCDVEAGNEPVLASSLEKDIGGIRRLSFHETRHEFEHLQLRPISGNLAVVDINGSSDLPVPLWVTGATDEISFALIGADAVWSRLLEAISSRHQCASPPCRKGRHIHTEWADLAEEMSRVQGAVIVRRPDLADAPGKLAPAVDLDFVQTLHSYFGIFKSSLFPTRMMVAGRRLAEVYKNRRFVDAVAEGDSAAARYLSMYYGEVEVPKRASDGYENTPTLVGMADVYINKLGHVWNEKDYIVPKSCKTNTFGPRARISLPTRVKSYEKVFVMAQHWGEAYYHFVVEALPRITVMLDILQENVDIKIAVRASDPYGKDSTSYVHQFLELLGINRNRVIFIQEEIHAALAILPSSAPCGKPDTQTTNLLRNALLKGIYPSRAGTPFPVSRPVIVLIVRTTGRGLNNNDKVREALKQEFPSYDLKEFFGTGSIILQLQLFARASLIVGPHGAGLSNMVVSPLHTPVLEIGPPDCTTCYVHLAVKLQHIYARHLVTNNDWTTPCLSKYEPNVSEIIHLARDLLEGKQQADTADQPKPVDVQ